MRDRGDMRACFGGDAWAGASMSVIGHRGDGAGCLRGRSALPSAPSWYRIRPAERPGGEPVRIRRAGRAGVPPAPRRVLGDPSIAAERQGAVACRRAGVRPRRRPQPHARRRALGPLRRIPSGPIHVTVPTTSGRRKRPGISHPPLDAPSYPAKPRSSTASRSRALAEDPGRPPCRASPRPPQVPDPQGADPSPRRRAHPRRPAAARRPQRARAPIHRRHPAPRASRPHCPSR